MGGESVISQPVCDANGVFSERRGNPALACAEGQKKQEQNAWEMAHVFSFNGWVSNSDLFQKCYGT